MRLFDCRDVQVTIKVKEASKPFDYVFIFRENPVSPVLFIVNRKLVRFPEAQAHCGDYLYFRKYSTQGYVGLRQFHCNGITNAVEIWNQEFSTHVYDFFEIVYQPTYEGAGGKFWLAVEGEYNSPDLGKSLQIFNADFMTGPMM